MPQALIRAKTGWLSGIKIAFSVGRRLAAPACHQTGPDTPARPCKLSSNSARPRDYPLKCKRWPGVGQRA